MKSLIASLMIICGMLFFSACTTTEHTSPQAQQLETYLRHYIGPGATPEETELAIREFKKAMGVPVAPTYIKR